MYIVSQSFNSFIYFSTPFFHGSFISFLFLFCIYLLCTLPEYLYANKAYIKYIFFVYLLFLNGSQNLIYTLLCSGFFSLHNQPWKAFHPASFLMVLYSCVGFHYRSNMIYLTSPLLMNHTQEVSAHSLGEARKKPFSFQCSSKPFFN